MRYIMLPVLLLIAPLAGFYFAPFGGPVDSPLLSAARPIRHQHSRDSAPLAFRLPGSPAPRIECARRGARTKL